MVLIREDSLSRFLLVVDALMSSVHNQIVQVQPCAPLKSLLPCDPRFTVNSCAAKCYAIVESRPSVTGYRSHSRVACALKMPL